MNLAVIFMCFFLYFDSTEGFNDAKCEEQLKKFEDSLRDREPWAVRMFDLWANLPTGLLHGNLHSPGHFTECVEFRHDDIQGQHCMVTTTVNSSGTSENLSETELIAKENNLKLVRGICVPATCSVQKVIEYSNQKFKELEAADVVCKNNDPIPLKGIDIAAIVIFSILSLILISSTIYDLVMIRKAREPNKLLIAFSVYTNGSKLFKIDKRNSPNVIRCLDGIKTLSIFWIICGHRFDERLLFPAVNNVDNFQTNFLYSFYVIYEKPVDTFFVIGGLLACWSIMSALDKKTLNIPRLYLHRYLRYTPALIFVIIFFMSFTKFLASGPFFNPLIKNCENNWWATVFHLSVYTNPLEICLDYTWYLAVDFQLFLITPFLVYPLWRWRRKFFWFLPLLVILGMACTAATMYNNSISVYEDEKIEVERMPIWLSKFYYPSHLRIPPWVIGVMLGYFMYKTRGERVKFNKNLEIFLWIFFAGLFIATNYITYLFALYKEDTSNMAAHALFGCFFRVGWSLSVAWIIFACQNGSGSIIRWFLSLRVWQPLGRMGLSIYLTHRIYQIVTTVNQKQPIYWDFFAQSQKFFGDALMSVFFGAILYLAVETPVMLVENFLHKKLTEKK